MVLYEDLEKKGKTVLNFRTS